MTTVLIKNLEFGVTVLKGDFIKLYPTSCGTSRIDEESDLNEFKSKYGHLPINIDRTQHIFDIFSIPAWDKKTKAQTNGIKQQLQNWK